MHYSFYVLFFFFTEKDGNEDLLRFWGTDDLFKGGEKAIYLGRGGVGGAQQTQRRV